MEEAIVTLAEIGAGPTTVRLGDGSAHEIEFETVEVEGSGLTAAGTDRAGANRRYRIERPPHANGPLTLEARSLPDGEWTEFGRIAFVEADD